MVTVFYGDLIRIMKGGKDRMYNIPEIKATDFKKRPTMQELVKKIIAAVQK